MKQFIIDFADDHYEELCASLMLAATIFAIAIAA